MYQPLLDDGRIAQSTPTALIASLTLPTDTEVTHSADFVPTQLTLASGASQGIFVVKDDPRMRRVRALIARAAAPGAAPREADTARAKADELLLRYGLHELDAVEPVWGSPRAPSEPAIVHWMSGFSPSGSKVRATCRCGYETTPRADDDRALRALAADHNLDAAECVLCGVTYEDTNWLDLRQSLQLMKDPIMGDEYPMCLDPAVCMTGI